MAKTKSVWSRLGSFLFGMLKWSALHLFALLKWLVLSSWSALKWLIRSAKTTTQSAKAAHAESKRPHQKPEFSALSEVEPMDGSLSDFESHLYSHKSSIGIILGARGSGKSALGMRILENVNAQSGRPIFAMGFDRLSLPKWMTAITKLDEVKNGGFLLVDEGGIAFSSRSSMSDANKLLSELLFISRHKDLSVLFISQNSSNLEVNAIRQTDFLLLKAPSLLQQDFERKVIQDIYSKIKVVFKKLLPAHPGLFYVHSDTFQGFAENDLPGFWNERVSKAYRNRAKT